MISSPDWRQRHAALMAISSIAEGTEKYMRAELDRVLDIILPRLGDPHPRVRWAACNAVGQLSTDLAPTVQKNAHQRIMVALVPLLESNEPRVQAHAAAALVNFCEAINEDDIIEPYLDGILERLLGLLRSPKRYVQEQAVTTIATVADAASTKFAKYYDVIMPLLIAAMQAGDGKEYRILRAKAVECATLIALAVGKATFTKDAIVLMENMARIQRSTLLFISNLESITEPDDPQASYLITAWGRICRTLGEDFAQFLPDVMPALIKSAKLKPDFVMIDGIPLFHHTNPDEDDKEQYSADDGWDFIPLHGQQIGIKTSVLEEKCTAYEMLCCYAQELKGQFYPYLQTVLDELIIPGLKFYFHDGVRSAAAKCLAYLVESAKAANPQDLSIANNVFRTVIDALVVRIAEEGSPDVCAEFFDAFYETVEVAGNNSLTAADMNKLVDVMASQLRDYGTRKTNRDEQIQSGERDIEEDADTQEEEEIDEILLSSMSKSIHTVFKRHGITFLPIWSQMIPYIEAGFASAEPSTRAWAICIIDDVIEYCNGDALNYVAPYLQTLITFVTDECISG
jgi:importin-5